MATILRAHMAHSTTCGCSFLPLCSGHGWGEAIHSLRPTRDSRELMASWGYRMQSILPAGVGGLIVGLMATITSGSLAEQAMMLPAPVALLMTCGCISPLPTVCPQQRRS